jgi:hypothetical protein
MRITADYYSEIDYDLKSEAKLSITRAIKIDEILRTI